MKTYENFINNSNYEVGNCVELWSGLICRIISINTDKTFDVELFMGNRWILYSGGLSTKNFKKKLTNSEIEEWELENDANKYNL